MPSETLPADAALRVDAALFTSVPGLASLGVVG
jgi:hypothetical protein